MAWYRTGTISLSNGSTTVTGVGTAFIANSAVGEALYAPDGKLYEIASVSSDTYIVLATNYLGSTGTTQPFVIVPSQSYIRDLAAQAATLVNNYSTIYNTVGAGKFADGTLSVPAIRFATDTSTGFYKSDTNEITFVANGVAQFKYNATTGLTALTGITVSNLTSGAIPIAGTGGVLQNSTLTYDGTTLTATKFSGALNGSVGATTPSTGKFTSLTDSGLTSGRIPFSGTGGLLQDAAALTFDGTTLAATKLSGGLNGSLGATTPSTAVVTSLTDSGLTAGRVTYADTGGLLKDSSALTFDGTTLSATKLAGAVNGSLGATTPSTAVVTSLNATSVTDSGLTSGRVPFAGTGGLLQDNAALTFDGTTLSATKLAGAHNGSVGATTPSTGAFTTLSATTPLAVSSGGTGSSTGIATPQFTQYTSGSGTYTTPAGAKYLIVKMVGGGGGGGNSSATTVGGGGGSGGYLEGLITSPLASYSYAVGEGGSGGTNGGTTTFGTSLFSATYGSAGTSSSTTAYGGAAGTATGGYLNQTGGYGTYGWANSSVPIYIGGQGASTPLGMGGSGAGTGNGAGGASSGYGSGGGGGGGAGGGSYGSGGIIIVTAYF